jgi:NAD(P)-dependent dehydrogenase (short-subunit alcohol dehydrogenase family)
MGAACVERLTAEGTRCAIGYVSNDEAARAVAETASAFGPAPVLVKGDVSTEGPAMVEQANELLDGVDSIVITAYPHIVGRALPITHEEYQRAFDVHYWGTLDAIRAAAPSLEAAGGSVVIVSSVATFRYARYYGVLGPSKAAMESLMVYLAAELGPRGIRLNVVQPQLVAGDRADDEGRIDAGDSDISGMGKILEDARRRTPLRRLAKRAELANACVALLSSDFSYVTGQILPVDGGYGIIA